MKRPLRLPPPPPYACEAQPGQSAGGSKRYPVPRMVTIVSVSSLRRRRTIRESIERSKASVFSAGAAAMISSRVKHFARIGQKQPQQRHLPGRELLFVSGMVHDQRGPDVDGRVFQGHEFRSAPCRGATSSPAIRAASSRMSAGASTTSAAPSSSASTVSTSSVFARTRIAAGSASLCRCRSRPSDRRRRKLVSQHDHIDLRRHQKRAQFPLFVGATHFVATPDEIIRDLVGMSLGEAAKCNDRSSCHG